MGYAKGKEFERSIDQWLRVLRANGVYGQKNNASRTHDGLYRKGESFDYLIIHKDGVICFDAKECHGSRWNLKTNAKDSQIENLALAKRNGADAFFLVWFKQSNVVVKFNVDVVWQAKQEGIKSLTAEDGEVWEILEIIKLYH